MDNEKLIITVKRDILFEQDYFEGFKLQTETDYESRILKNLNYMKRSFAEKDITYKQPISYSIILNPDLKQIFTYQRSLHDKNYTEKRLQGKWSCGVGGHIEKQDMDGNPIHLSMLRELEEEVEIAGTINPKVLGYINDDSDDVGKVHFGILYLIETDSTTVKPKSHEIDNGKLRTIEELDVIFLSPEFKIEEWSKIALKPLKSYLYKP